MGNVGDGRDRRVVAALRRALADHDPLVRGHAVWAAVHLGRGDLVAPLISTESNPEVRAELRAAGLGE
jgi:HEAT repeat protein